MVSFQQRDDWRAKPPDMPAGMDWSGRRAAHPFECTATLDLFKFPRYQLCSSLRSRIRSSLKKRVSPAEGVARGERLTTFLAIEVRKRKACLRSQSLVCSRSHCYENTNKTLKTSVIWLMEPWVRLSIDSVVNGWLLPRTEAAPNSNYCKK